MGGDAIKGPEKLLLSVSIHAPAWGATDVGYVGVIGVVFQSTPPHGGRLKELWLRDTSESFNPRPRMGGDDNRIRALAAKVIVSIHAPAWGRLTL